MLDPLTFSAMDTVAFIEGIKLLNDHVSEILKRWLEHKDAARDTEI